MPPMATSSKRKWSDVFQDEEMYDKQSIMDLCTAKLRYVNPARPPRRRTEVPLLRNVLIVNTMKHLSTEMKQESMMDYATEDLTVDPGHFEGLPPLSELLTDIMLDPQPNESQCPTQGLIPFNWSTSGAASYSPLTPLEPSMPSYLDTDSALENTGEEKIVHDLLPCTSVIGLNPSHHSPWEAHGDTGSLDSFLSSASLQQPSTDTLDSFASDSAFQSTSGPLPSFTSLFENSNLSYSETVPTSSYTDLTPTASPSMLYSSTATSSASFSAQTTVASASTEELVGNTTLTDTELEFLAMAFSSKLHNVSFEELVQAFPQSTRLQQQNSQQSSFFVPSSIQTCSSSTSNTSVTETSPTTSNPCASFYRKDQPPPSVDENMVRVLVNL
ncbi:putative GPI-anchored protein pfl2 [Aplysia californica]|uniref:GPI-anchored protein pfl2 n=1 Tax=Aplysia californica TaxID=6500 RepID=A0ABM0JJA7_APLCA|nr:putative GPI-anchored protein pfl2 [Aplysia californica]